jgi:hypothetical protein
MLAISQVKGFADPGRDDTTSVAAFSQTAAAILALFAGAKLQIVSLEVFSLPRHRIAIDSSFEDSPQSVIGTHRPGKWDGDGPLL